MERKPIRWIAALLAVPLLTLAGAVAPQPAMCAVSDATGATPCCKVCTKGKACGDSCIARDKICHKGAGCACNG